MPAALEADIPRKRGLNAISVDIDELSRARRRGAYQSAVCRKLFDLSKDIPGRPKLPSPVASSYLQSTSAWQWLLAFFVKPYWRSEGIEADAPWRSKLAPPKMLLHRGIELGWFLHHALGVCSSEAFSNKSPSGGSSTRPAKIVLIGTLSAVRAGPSPHRYPGRSFKGTASRSKPPRQIRVVTLYLFEGDIREVRVATVASRARNEHMV